MDSVHAVDTASAPHPVPANSGALVHYPVFTEHQLPGDDAMAADGAVPSNDSGALEQTIPTRVAGYTSQKGKVQKPCFKKQRMVRTWHGRFVEAGNHDEAAGGNEEPALLEISAEALQEMDVNKRREFVLIADKLGRTRDRFPLRREKDVPEYVDKANFYITTVRKYRPLRPLVFTIPFEDTSFDVTIHKGGSINSNALAELILRYLRALDFTGHQTLTGQCSYIERIDFFFHRLGYCTRCIGQGAYPGEAEFFALARLKIIKRMRALGVTLLQGGLVRIVEASGVKKYEWSPACDVFNDPNWRFSGQWPDARAPSTSAGALPAGYLLDQVATMHVEDA